MWRVCTDPNQIKTKNKRIIVKINVPQKLTTVDLISLKKKINIEKSHVHWHTIEQKQIEKCDNDSVENNDIEII